MDKVDELLMIEERIASLEERLSRRKRFNKQMPLLENLRRRRNNIINPKPYKKYLTPSGEDMKPTETLS